MSAPDKLYLSKDQAEFDQHRYILDDEALKKGDIQYIRFALVDLEAFCRFLEKEGYLDSDWYAEQPTALERWAEFQAKEKK